MLRRGFRIGVLLGVLLAGALATTRLLRTRREPALPLPPAPTWPPLARDQEPEPVLAPDPGSYDPGSGARTDVAALIEEPPGVEEAVAQKAAAKKAAVKKAAVKKAATPRAKKPAPWVEPVEGTCPPTHLVKAKLASKLYHEPGMFAYDRTRPDRCYLDGPAAEADGFTRAKR